MKRNGSRGGRLMAGGCAALLACSLSAVLPQWGAMQPAGAKSRDGGTAGPSEDHYKDGMKRMKEGDYGGAADSFLQAIYFSRNRYHPEAWKWLGLCYKAQRNYPKAAEALIMHIQQRTVISCDPHLDLAEVYMDMGDFDRAEKEIDAGYTDMAVGENTSRQRYTVGRLKEKMGIPEAALGNYETAKIDRKNYTEAYMGAARCLVKMGRWKEALAKYDEMLNKGPALRGMDYTELYYNMGTCYLKLGNHQGAIDHWRLALNENPEHFDSHLALGNLFDQEQHISSAISEYQAAMRTAPKTYNKAHIGKRILFLENLLKPKAPPPQVARPMPQMRRPAPPTGSLDTATEFDAPKESGF